MITYLYISINILVRVRLERRSCAQNGLKRKYPTLIKILLINPIRLIFFVDDVRIYEPSRFSNYVICVASGLYPLELQSILQRCQRLLCHRHQPNPTLPLDGGEVGSHHIKQVLYPKPERKPSNSTSSTLK